MPGRKKECQSSPEGASCDIAIIGAGPAGLAAGIYGARIGLKCIVLEKGVAGGQVALSPWIENYPGFPRIEGIKLMDIMAAHAKEYVEIREGAEVIDIEPLEEGFKITSSAGELTAKGVILAMGATHRKLNIEGEDEYYGRGVSYCATCDGYFFRKKRVVVVGGGNTALTDAMYLHSIGCDVTLVHRREQLRADKHLQETAADKGLRIVLETVVERIVGDGNSVTGVELANLATGEKNLMETNGVFVAVGTVPSSALAKPLCVKMDQNGFIEIDRTNRTNIPFIYAAGDSTGGILQIVAAVHGGAVAAISAFEDLADPYYTRTRRSETTTCPVPGQDGEQRSAENAN